MYARFLGALIACALSLNVGFTGTDEDAKKIQGIWKIVSLKGPGETPPEEVVKNARVIITATQLSFLVGLGKDVATYKLNTSKKPREIDLVAEVRKKSKEKEVKFKQIMLGIYHMVGDDLILCINPDDPTKRPPDFKGGKDAIVMILKRDK